MGEKLFLKGEKCNSPKCPFLKRSYAPGDAGAKSKPRRGSDFSIQLKEKQKARAIYGVSERQMSNYYDQARKTKGQTGAKLIEQLERRLDNVVFRCGFADSRDQARQMISHGDILIGSKKVKTASYQTKIGDQISNAAKSPKKPAKIESGWLKTSASQTAEITGYAQKDELSQINEQLIIEYYSR